MASTLSVSYQGVGTLYVVIRRNSDDYVWNGTAFEAWADGSIGTYDVPMTSAGGDWYVVDFPSAIAAGDCTVFYYEQAGGSPAITDLILRTETRHWDGAALSDASTVTLSAYALTTLDAVKRYMGITDSNSDTLLTELINAVSSQVETITARQFKARDYRYWHTGQRQRRLVLRNFPIQHVTRVAWGANNAMTVTYSGAAIRASASVYRDPESADAGGIRLVTISTAGVRTASNLAFSDYPSLSLLATHVATLSGWSATVLQNMPSADLHITGGEDALGRSVVFTYPDQDEFAYRLDNVRGIIEFDRYAGGGWWWGDCAGRFPDNWRGVLIEYNAGYVTIPADVEQVAKDLVKETYHLRKSNTGVLSSKLGPYAVQFRDDQLQVIRARLAPYMDGAALIGGAT